MIGRNEKKRGTGFLRFKICIQTKAFLGATIVITTQKACNTTKTLQCTGYLKIQPETTREPQKVGNERTFHLFAPHKHKMVEHHGTGLSLTQKKKKSRPEPGNFKRACGHSMCSTMDVAVGGWRLAAVGGWQFATGGWWRLVAVGGGWWLAVGGWRQLAVVGSWRLVAAGGWRRLVAGGWWRLVVGGWWRLAVDGSWRLAVGGPLGLSLRAVLRKKKKISFLNDAPAMETACKTSFPKALLVVNMSKMHFDVFNL